tara:strand:+ start:4951 stop:5535 length:585 start_codon:yes stop_codon:yes gene_type:complete
MADEKKNYNDIVPKTRNYVEEEPEEKKNYDDIVPKTRSYLGEAFKRSIDNPYGVVEELESPSNESPRDLEEGPIQTVPDIRESPDDPEEHKQHVENKERAALRARADEVMDMLAKNFHFDRAGGHSDRMTVPSFIQAGLEYGHSPEKLLAEMSKPENVEYFGLVPLSQAERSGDPLDFIRMQREAAARTALESE